MFFCGVKMLLFVCVSSRVCVCLCVILALKAKSLYECVHFDVRGQQSA